MELSKAVTPRCSPPTEAGARLVIADVNRNAIDTVVASHPTAEVVNAGGVIQVADEIEGFVFERARRRASGIHETTRAVFPRTDADGTTPAAAGDRLAEQRMAEIGRLRSILVNRLGPL